MNVTQLMTLSEHTVERKGGEREGGERVRTAKNLPSLFTAKCRFSTRLTRCLLILFCCVTGSADRTHLADASLTQLKPTENIRTKATDL